MALELKGKKNKKKPPITRVMRGLDRCEGPTVVDDVGEGRTLGKIPGFVSWKISGGGTKDL